MPVFWQLEAVECVFRVMNARYAALLRFGNRMNRQRRLARRFGHRFRDDAATLGYPPTQALIDQRDRARPGMILILRSLTFLCTACVHPHDRPLADILFYLFITAFKTLQLDVPHSLVLSLHYSFSCIIYLLVVIFLTYRCRCRSDLFVVVLRVYLVEYLFDGGLPRR